MPRITNDENVQRHKTGHFGFSAVRIEDLGSSEYTLVTIVADRSGSVGPFQADMEKALKEILSACMKSPRADNLMIRLVTFDSNVTEVHGFKLLSQINPDDYDGVLLPGGMTAVYDASVSAIEAGNNYGRTLLENDMSVNAIFFVITDGGDNMSKLGTSNIKSELERGVSGECLESLVSILIGVNVQEPMLATYLAKLTTDAGFTQYVELKDASKGTLAKLAQFVSKSVSSQSQSLGTGGASQSINF
jgi:uncharacterized protein YegL